MSLKKIIVPVGLVMAAAATAGCPIVISPDPMPSTGPVVISGNRAPIIAAFDYSPKTAVGKNDTITFTVVANDAEGDVLQYNWTSTKGTLSGNTGLTVGWKPTKADGTIEPGLTTVQVLVSDGRQTTVGSVNIQINEQGEATVGPVVLPTPSATATSAPTSAPATAAPTSAPTTAPTVEPTVTPTDSGAINGTVLFQDGFDAGEGDFNLWKPYIFLNQSVSWKVVPGGAQGSANAVIINDAEDEIKAGSSYDYDTLTVADPIDLTNAKYPRVRFYFKNPATPGSSVTFQAQWRPENGTLNDIASAFSGSKDWGYKDFNLAPFKGKPGSLTLQINIDNPSAKFSGPMIDNVTVYDAAQ